MKTATALILALAASPAFAHNDHGQPHIHIDGAVMELLPLIIALTAAIAIGAVLYFKVRK